MCHQGNCRNNTLGNLDGFDPENLVQPEEMPELDRWAVTKLNELIDLSFRSYDKYEFHALTHAINDFCVVELSGFYLDILKDRLYCEEKDGLKRRSAQTALYLILDALAKMYAPILPYTCDEIWQAMPHKAADDVRNIVLNDMAQAYTAYALDAAAMEKWDRLIALRSDVNGVLEAARAEKKIGKALEAKVCLGAKDEAAKEALEAVAGLDLAELFIVSAVSVEEAEGEALAQGAGTNYPGLEVKVYAAPGTKCPRCWMHSTQADAEGLCPRCSAVMSNFVFED